MRVPFYSVEVHEPLRGETLLFKFEWVSVCSEQPPVGRVCVASKMVKTSDLDFGALGLCKWVYELLLSPEQFNKFEFCKIDLIKISFKIKTWRVNV